MAYCTQTDVERAAGGAAKLLQLADHDADNAIDAAVLSGVITDVERWIDSYAQRRHSVPFSPVPALITRLCADEVVYRLKDARAAVSDQAERRHAENLAWLESLSTGLVSVGVDPPPAKSTSVKALTGDREDVTGAITRKTMEGFA